MSAVHVYLCAVVVMASTISIMRCRAESVPMVMSVPQKSLSMEPTMPTMLRWEEHLASLGVILPERKLEMAALSDTLLHWHGSVRLMHFTIALMDVHKNTFAGCVVSNFYGHDWLSPAFTRSPSSSVHSVLNWLAPVRLPSPPITQRLVIPSLTKLHAALVRPSLVRKSWQRALPITVPPWCQARRKSVSPKQFSPGGRKEGKIIWNLSAHVQDTSLAL